MFDVPKNILIAPELAFTIGVRVSNSGILAGADGKKIIKAGYPLAGDIEQRNTAFTATKTGAVGICLHDVDVTNGDSNATIVLSGVIDLNKIDTTTAAQLDTATKTALNRIIFIKGE